MFREVMPVTPIDDPLKDGIVVGPDVNDEPKKDEAPKQ